ncbi:MAG: superoxide dismutase [Armatimonadota bacterium]
MAYQAQDYSRILGMDGISDNTLQNHFKLYQGYVTNTNTLIEKLDGLLDEGKERTPEFAELQRRVGFEFCGMRLHEYYFENLKGNGSLDKHAMIYGQIERDFGGFERWKQDFTAVGAMRGVGWAVMFYDTRHDMLVNQWITLHQDGVLPGVQPLLVMDVWEHAFMLDYATDRPKYLEAFFRNLNWTEVEKRFQANSEVQKRKAA